MVIQSLKVPRITVTMSSEQSYEVTLDESGEIWPMLLAGVLRGMADDYGALAVITAHGRDLLVDVAMTEYSMMRPFVLIPENATGTGP